MTASGDKCTVIRTLFCDVFCVILVGFDLYMPQRRSPSTRKTIFLPVHQEPFWAYLPFTKKGILSKKNELSPAVAGSTKINSSCCETHPARGTWPELQNTPSCYQGTASGKEQMYLHHKRTCARHWIAHLQNHHQPSMLYCPYEVVSPSLPNLPLNREVGMQKHKQKT